MPCYHPLTAYGLPTNDPYKCKIVFLKKEPTAEHLASIGAEKLQLPCGQCIGCRLEYSRQWATRCVLEAKQWQHNYFLTLTYDDEHLPMHEHYKVDTETGEVMDSHFVPVLEPDELKNFIKRFREIMRRDYEKTNIRFFACGEYGDRGRRPHFHIILFNAPIPDLKYEYAHNGNVFYSSEIIDRAWQGRGMTLVSDFSYDCAAYVAKYILKKHKGLDAQYYVDEGLVPEFTRCSRRPGIGKAYYDEHKDEMYKFDSLVVKAGYGKVINSSPPKYFDRLFADEDPETLKANKERRKESAELSMLKQLENTTLPHDEYLEVLESNKLFNAAGSVRPL